MRAVIQRVTAASVTVDGDCIGRIGPGLLVLVAVAAGDSERDAEWLAAKLADLRIFSDAAGKFARSVRDIRGGILVISQFTLYGDTRKGRRPSFTDAAAPDLARHLYDRVVHHLQRAGIPVASGRFGAHMEVQLTNDGPVTLIIDSPAQPTQSGSSASAPPS